jgi:hypothetical protein
MTSVFSDQANSNKIWKDIHVNSKEKNYYKRKDDGKLLNPLTPELNPSAQRCLTRFFTGNFAS